MPSGLDDAVKWLQFGQAIMAQGLGAWNAIKAAAAANGVEADTAALDAVIVDAARREEIARRDAEG